MKGKFISFEGIEGTGKSTQARLLSDYLKGRGFEVVLTAEPGGTRLGEKIRELLLSIELKEMLPLTELLLYFASRAQHVREIILPAIKKGAIVITDRFTDSTIAYQGYGRGINLKLIDSIDMIATSNLRPDITLLLDLDVETGLKRNRGVKKTDRIEREDIRFHRKVRSGYLDLSVKESGRIKLINASGSLEEVRHTIITVISSFLSIR